MDMLDGKIRPSKDFSSRQSKKLKDLGDIARHVESYPHLLEVLPVDLHSIVKKQDPLH